MVGDDFLALCLQHCQVHVVRYNTTSHKLDYVAQDYGMFNLKVTFILLDAWILPIGGEKGLQSMWLPRLVKNHVEFIIGKKMVHFCQSFIFLDLRIAIDPNV